MPIQYENSTMQLDYIEYVIGIKLVNSCIIGTKVRKRIYFDVFVSCFFNL